jgi:hypothetical protein
MENTLNRTQALSDLFIAGELPIEQPKISKGQAFKDKFGHSKRFIRNMKRAGVETPAVYRTLIKNRKRRERLHKRIKYTQTRAQRVK